MIDALDTNWWRHTMDFLFEHNPVVGSFPAWVASGSDSGNSESAGESTPPKQQQQQQQPEPWSWKNLPFLANRNRQDAEASHKPQPQQQSTPPSSSTPLPATSWWQGWLDPNILHARPSAATLTDLIDKVLTSTPRLLAIANLLLALTYQMHTAVADWFLGAGVYPPPGEWAMTGRERLGSFLVFKLLLISAVVAPDTLDLLILLSWYTLLSFLRSLAHLAAATTSHTTQSGQPPRAGVLQLLLVVLLCDFVAAGVCVALFQAAGAGMVILLTCDCALLAVEVLGHILKHLRQVLEDMHEATIAGMEEQQLQIHARQRRAEERQQRQLEQQSGATGAGQTGTTEASEANTGVGSNHNTRADEDWDHLDDLDGEDDDADDGIRTLPQNNQFQLMEDSRRLDQAMDVLELQHSRRLAVLDTTIFVLQLLVHAITVGHFLHIWTLHGIQFTLIDGVLALHLHSALSAASKQIAERRNLHRIARNLDGMFPNASDLDLKLAHTSGDVCCICLGAMSVGSVKKVGCGHLYHTNCLREVIERAHSIEAAKCPLCRASVVDGSHPGTNSNANDADQPDGRVPGRVAGENDINANNADNNGGNADNVARIGRPTDGMNHRGERALFRFSTEGILPSWMPLPAFSFEVVRRPTRQEQQPPTMANTNNNGNNMANQGGLVGQRNNNQNIDNNNYNEQSFFRRLLLLAGALPMSPEEEARALAQLVDMFPQYDRADLLRELRDRGSAESVVESVLLGVFSGRVRGSAGAEPAPATANNPAVAADEHETGNPEPPVQPVPQQM